MSDPIGDLIATARKRVLNGKESHTASSPDCSCYVEITALSRPRRSSFSGLITQSTREHYSRCHLHPVR